MKGLVPHRWRQVWAVTRWVAVASALPLIWACNSRSFEAPTPNPVSVVNTTFQATLNREIDILFMVDNSSSMLPLQAKLLLQFPVFMNVLKMLPAPNGAGTALPDIHVAVVSSDSGPGKYDLPQYHCSFRGDSQHIGGLFQSQPQGACTTSPFKSADQHYLSASMNQSVTNYNGDITAAFTCIAALGDQGCGFESQLKTPRWALDPLNVPPGNEGFLRPEAFLAVILITNEDDCSVPDDSDLIDPTQTTMASQDGPLWSWRCNEFGHLCKDQNGNLAPPARAAANMLQGCISNNLPSNRLTNLDDEISFLKALKPNEPNKLFVAAIAGPATPYSVEMIMQGNDTEMHPNVVHSCTQGDGTYADPSVRLLQWVQAFGDHGLFETICADSFAPALGAIAKELSQLLGPQCISDNLVDTDLNTPGIQPECQVVDQYVQDTKTFSTVLQSCASNGDTPPCWSFDPDAQKCPGNSLLLNVNRGGAQLPNGLQTLVSCSQCLPNVPRMGCP